MRLNIEYVYNIFAAPCRQLLPKQGLTSSIYLFVIYLQDDFLDLAADESQHSADIALCLQTGASSVPPSLSSKDELRSEAGSTSTSETQLDNPSMKLENLDSWDQDV